MNLKIEFERPLGVKRQAALEREVRSVLEGHPLFAGGVCKPGALVVRITVGMDKRTAIDHTSFPAAGYIRLDLDEIYYPLDRKVGEPLFTGDTEFHPRFGQLLAHEFSHFIDARLTPAFGYGNDKRPSDSGVLSVHLNLWDSYIDVRLGDLAPHSLSERQHEAEQVNGVP